MIHCDIWGGYRVASLSGAHYFLLIVDDYSRATWVFLMRHKSETQSPLRHFILYVKTQFSTQVQTLRTDNGQGFLANDLELFLREEGIVHQRTCIHTSQ